MSLLTDSGAFLGINPLFDVAQIEQMDINSEDFKRLIVSLFITMNDVVQLTNQKDTARYLTTEFNTSGQLFSVDNSYENLRPIFRVVVPCGALPAAGTKTIPHGIEGITSSYSLIYMIGGATRPSPVSWIPLPFSSATGIASNIEISADDTNVYITTGGTDYSAYTVSYVILFYVQF